MDDIFLFSVSLGITVLGLLGSWAAYRRRGAASGLRGTAWSLVPMAFYLTGLTTWLSDLVFSPVKWAGVVVAGLAFVLYMVSGVMLRKGGAAEQKAVSGDEARKAAGSSRGSSAKGEVEERKSTGRSAADPDLAEIEEILRNRGIG